MTDRERRNLRFRIYWIPFLFGVFLLFFAAIFSEFTLGWGVYVGSLDLWFLFAVVALAVGAIILGISAAVEAYTPPLVTSSGVIPQAEWNPLTVVTHRYAVDQSVIAREVVDGPKTALMVPETLIDDRGRPIEMVKPLGSDAKNRIVPIKVVPLGGIKAFGIILSNGNRGFLILHGDEDIPMGDMYKGQYHFIPKTIRQIPYDQVPQEAIDLIKNHPEFKEYESPFFECGWYDPNFVQYIRDHAESVRKMMDEPGKASLYGEADPTYFQEMWHMALSENFVLKQDRRTLLDMVKSHGIQMAGQARRAANASRAPPQRDSNLAISDQLQDREP